MKLILIGLLALALNASAGERGNGGDAVVTSDNAIRLRDLIDPGNCTWKSGKSVLAQKGLTSILEKVADANPYFAYKLEEQILKIKWCYTATLKKVETNDDEETLTYYLDPYAQNKIQAGIRVVNNVYIDRSILAPNLIDGKLIEQDRPYFYIHEAMHAFLFMNTSNRNKRVRDAVKAVKDFYMGDTNADDFDSMISGNDLLIMKADSPVQKLLKVLADDSLTVNERVDLGKTVLSPNGNNDQLVMEWKELQELLSDDELSILTKKTGLTRFEFIKRTRGNIFLRRDIQPHFKDSFNLFLTNIPFGRCRSNVYDLGENESFVDSNYNRRGYPENHEGFYWLRVYDKNDGILITKDRRHTKRYSDVYYTSEYKTGYFYTYRYDLGREFIMKKFFFESLCDFTPLK